MTNELSVYRGDTLPIIITVVDNAGAAYNLTGFTMRIMVKSSKTDPDSSALITATATISSPTTGIGNATITSVQTELSPNIYYYEVEIRNSSVTPNIVYTIAESTLTITTDLRRGT